MKYRNPNDPIYLKIDVERAREIVSKILNDETYLLNLKKRALLGVLAPAMEMMLWHYMYGKPQDTVNVNISDDREDLTKLTDEQLAERMEKKAMILREKKSEPEMPMN